MKHGPALIKYLDKKLASVKKKDIAEKIGVSPSTLSSYWTTRAAMPQEYIDKLIRVFHLNRVEVLFVAYGLHNALAMQLVTIKELISDAHRIDSPREQAIRMVSIAEYMTEKERDKFLRRIRWDALFTRMVDTAAEAPPAYGDGEKVHRAECVMLPVLDTICRDIPKKQKNKQTKLLPVVFPAGNGNRYYLRPVSNAMAPMLQSETDTILVENYPQPLQADRQSSSRGRRPMPPELADNPGAVFTLAVDKEPPVMCRIYCMQQTSSRKNPLYSVLLRVENSDWKGEGNWYGGCRLLKDSESLTVFGRALGYIRALDGIFL